MAKTPTAGQRLVAQLNKALRPDLEWSEAEQHTLATIQESADRAAILRTMFEAELARPEPTRYLLFLSSELRSTESHLVRMVRTLDPDGSAVSAKAQRTSVPPKFVGTVQL